MSAMGARGSEGARTPYGFEKGAVSQKNVKRLLQTRKQGTPEQCSLINGVFLWYAGTIRFSRSMATTQQKTTIQSSTIQRCAERRQPTRGNAEQFCIIVGSVLEIILRGLNFLSCVDATACTLRICIACQDTIVNVPTAPARPTLSWRG